MKFVLNRLNPKLFLGEFLKPDIRSKLLDIKDEFIKSLDISFDVVDVRLVGSNAAFNYTDHSDIDLHILVNFQTIGNPNNLVNLFFQAAKSNFNSKFDIKVKGYQVEVYVEDMLSSPVSNGIYSVLYDKWVKYPKPLKQPAIDEQELNQWLLKYNEAIASEDINVVKQLLDELYLYRKDSIAMDGELSQGNLVFKYLRANRYLDSLKDHYDDLESRRLSLESAQN